MISERKAGFGMYIIILAGLVALALVGCTAGTYRYECTNTCETRIAKQVVGIAISDKTHTNNISAWVRETIEGNINNQWNLRQYSSLWSHIDGTYSKKCYLISRLYQVREDPKATILLKKLQGQPDPIPKDLAVAIQEFVDGALPDDGQGEDPTVRSDRG